MWNQLFSIAVLCLGVNAVAQSYIGEIMTTGATFCPNGWVEADGRMLTIWDNDVLFQLIGTTYGGDGQSTFALPNLSGRTPVHSSNTLGNQSGQESVTLTTNQMPVHNHGTLTVTAETCIRSKNAVQTKSAITGSDFIAGLAVGNKLGYCDAPAADDTLNAVVMRPVPKAPALGSVGYSQPIPTRSPGLVLRYCISLFGIFPSN